MNFVDRFVPDEDAAHVGISADWIAAEAKMLTSPPTEAGSIDWAKTRIDWAKISKKVRGATDGGAVISTFSHLEGPAKVRRSTVSRIIETRSHSDLRTVGDAIKGISKFSYVTTNDIKYYIKTRNVALERRSIQRGRVERETQPALPLGGDFAPSSELVSYWIRGASTLLNGNINKVPSDIIDITIGSSEKTAFSKMVRDLLVVNAQDARYDGVKFSVLMKNLEFPVGLQVKLCERFFIIPSDSAIFLQLLASELDSALRSGVEISGSWGSVRAMASSDWYFDINPRIVRSEPFKKGRVVE